MTTMRATYVPGGWVAVAAPSTWLLLDLPPGHPVVSRCWSLLSDGRGVDDLLDALVAGGLRSMPAFALVHLGDDEQRVVVRGDARVEGSANGDDSLAVVAPADAPWVDRTLAERLERVELTGAPDGTGVEMPMAAGVTMAARILVTTDAIMPLPPDLAAAPAEPDTPTPVADIGTELAEEGPAEPDAPSYDFLFGATQRPPLVESEAIQANEPVAPSQPPEPARAPDETAGWNTMSALGAAEPPPPAEAAEHGDDPPASATELIDEVPWAAPAPAQRQVTPQWSPPPVVPPVAWSPPQPHPAAAQHPVATPVAEPDNVGQTVDRAALRAALSEPVVVGPTVLAGRCPAGHLSPPHAATCRVCNRPMPAQQAFEIPRPPLGVLRLSTGDVVTLDRGVLLGRAPSEPTGADERPHLVRLASPENDISRNHAEIVIDGWHVFVRDLGSTNGTTVTLPGQQPVRLRDNDLQLLESGAVVTLADEISATFEVSA